MPPRTIGERVAAFAGAAAMLSVPPTIRRADDRAVNSRILTIIRPFRDCCASSYEFPGPFIRCFKANKGAMPDSTGQQRRNPTAKLTSRSRAPILINGADDQKYNWRNPTNRNYDCACSSSQGMRSTMTPRSQWITQSNAGCPIPAPTRRW